MSPTHNFSFRHLAWEAYRRLPSPLFKRIFYCEDFHGWLEHFSLYDLRLALFRRRILLLPVRESEINPPNELFGRSLEPFENEVIAFSACHHENCHWSDLKEHPERHRVALELATHKYFSIWNTLYAQAKKWKPIAMVYPQGYLTIAGAMRSVSALLGLRTIAFERTFDRDKMILESETGIAVNVTSAKRLYREWTEPPTAVEKSPFSVPQKAGQHTSGASPFIRADIRDGRPLVIFLGQVFNDSAEFFSTGAFNTSLDMLKCVAAAVVKLDALLIIKFHPKEISGNNLAGIPINRVSSRIFRAWLQQQSFGNFNNFLLDDDNSYDTYNLIAAADAVITLNSQAGLEACLMNRAVVCGADAFYTGLGFTWDLASPGQIVDALQHALDRKGCRDIAGVRRFHHFYTSEYLVDINAEAMADRIAKVVFQRTKIQSPKIFR